MSIVAYVGLPGHGKSHEIVRNVILPSLKNKRPVFTNIPMNDDVCLNDFGMTVTNFSIDDIKKNANWWKEVFISGAVFVLDEAWGLWPAGMKADSIRASDKAFLAEHRHMVGENGLSTEIYFVTQDLSQLALFARTLVETTFRMVKLSSMGLDRSFRTDVYSGPVTGQKPPISKRERELHGQKFSKDVYKYYKSHTQSQTGGAGDEARTDKRYNVMGRLSIKLGFLLVLACIVFIYFGFGKVVRMYKPEVKNVPVNQPVKSNPSSPVRGGNIPQGAKVAVQQESREPKFLGKAQRINVSHIFGLAPNKVFYYKVFFENSEVIVTGMDLKRLGYSLDLINDCLVKVSGFDFNGFIMCPKSSRKDSGLIAGLATDMTSAGSDQNK